MYLANGGIAREDSRIEGAEADSLLLQWDRLLY